VAHGREDCTALAISDATGLVIKKALLDSKHSPAPAPAAGRDAERFASGALVPPVEMTSVKSAETDRKNHRTRDTIFSFVSSVRIK